MQEEQQLGFEKGLGFERTKSVVIVLIRLGIPSISLSLPIYRLGKKYPSTSRFTKGFLIKIYTYSDYTALTSQTGRAYRLTLRKTVCTFIFYWEHARMFGGPNT
jgi:hypothetical protein